MCPVGVRVVPPSSKGVNGDAVFGSVIEVARTQLNQAECEAASLGDAKTWWGQKHVGAVRAVVKEVQDVGWFDGLVAGAGSKVVSAAREAKKVVRELSAHWQQEVEAMFPVLR